MERDTTQTFYSTNVLKELVIKLLMQEGLISYPSKLIGRIISSLSIPHTSKVDMKKTSIGLLKIKEKPQSLVNQEKGRYFSSSYKYYKEWMDRYSDTPEREIPIMEKVGSIVWSFQC